MKTVKKITLSREEAIDAIKDYLVFNNIIEKNENVDSEKIEILYGNNDEISIEITLTADDI